MRLPPQYVLGIDVHCPAMRSETWVGSFASKILHNENFRTQFIKILKISPSKTSLKDGYHHIYTPAG